MSGSVLTADELRRVLDYDPQTGLFTWKFSPTPSVKKGDIAGSSHSEGYISIRIAKRLYFAHRLAWLWMKGDWPKDQIDHKDNNRSNNRWDNLRNVRPALNTQNQRKPPKSNTSGFLGVSAKRGKWRACIIVDGKQRFLGSFDTPEDASCAYIEAKRELHEGCTI